MTIRHFSKHPAKKYSRFVFLLFLSIYLIPAVVILLASEETTSSVTSLSQAQATPEPEYSVTVLKDNQKKQLDLESYVFGVVASEMPASFHIEALKAQAIAARTYIVHHSLKNDPQMKESYVTDTVSDQVYKTDEELQALWQDNYETYRNRISEAVEATRDQILVYQEEPIFPAFFSTSNGYTENAEDYWTNPLPYLVSVESPWDKTSPKFTEHVTFKKAEVMEQLKLTEDALLMIRTVYTDSGRLKWIAFGQSIFTGRELREALGLPSSDITVKVVEAEVVFQTKGYGHGVGMSQYGADGMAKDGYTHVDILKHYYQGVDITSLSNLR
ncbi:stage II sporulation protein D [Halolactibacillus alkaliphilus]|uniref:Stage II sporulation protein D n=1 Tax=Halolactibacillus alkaliphilus TaxID=442899 RepID=A0A511X459_9BACI|nr:stage II sporulation protein D [Halolactibacillus alkaliphilus]GEN57738.1 stage II sporulation protein D [Halolactibacillus alkaliphilus]GGN73852.1 stage II sporulation protein D [Halolactibacillus alkaliphilus]SFO98955.1 stage II sporulation protein D [Halolactibacillus alkaliphilus]